MNRSASILSVLLALSGCHVLRAGSLAPARVAPTPKIPYEKIVLPNGLQLILHVDRKLPVVHVNQWFHVGSKDERPGRTGFAHLFEHMMFQGSKNAPGEYFTYAERAGANLRAGGVNGTTGFDRTNYFATVPSGNLEFLLWLESDRLATLLDALDQKKLDNQRDVVKNERRQRYENTPYGRWLLLLTEGLFPAGHPYAWSPIGSHADLTAASLADVKEFFRRFYTPNNLTIAVTGDFDPAEAKRLVQKYFGGLPPGPALSRAARWVPVLAQPKVIETTDRVPLARVYLAWPSPPYFDSGDAELELAASILADGLASRLQRALIYDQPLCTDVVAQQWSFEISGVFILWATARPGVPLERIEAVLDREIRRLADDGPTEAELARARAKHEYDFVSGLERIGGFGGKADLLNRYNVFLGDPGKIDEDLARFRAVTTESLRAQVAKWIATPNRLVLRFRPERSRRVAGEALDRSRPPALGADRPFSPPAVRSARLENGLEVFVVERRDLPKVTVTLATRAGSVHDPAGKAGVAQLTVATIDLGTRRRTALQIERELAALGTRLVGEANREYAVLGFSVLKPNLDAALAIAGEVVQEPLFPAAEVERERKRHLDRLAQASRNANALAARIAPMLVFGRSHPYGRPVAGLPETVRAIGPEDLRRFHASRWRPGGSALIFAGDIGLDEAIAAARRAFGKWTGAAVREVPIPTPAPEGPGKIFLVDRPDAPQTLIALVLPAPPRKSEDYHALRLADAVWGGGGFGTRLNLNLREQKGYSYGVYSRLGLRSAAGSWWAAGSVQRDKTAESVVEFVNELKALAGERPVSADELRAAKRVRIRGYAQNFESLTGVAALVANLWSLSLPMSELAREPEETAKTPLEAVNAAARKWAVPRAASLLLVGDVARIEPKVRALGLGEVVQLDAWGRPVPK